MPAVPNVSKSAARRDACNGDGTSPSPSVPPTPTVERSKPNIHQHDVSDTPRASEIHPMLPLDPVQVVGELDVPCLTDADQRLLRKFKQSLAENKLTECPQCLTSWFTISLNQRTGVCQECTKDNAFRVSNPQLPALWSEVNELDPGEPPEHLEALGPLTPLEEWLVALIPNLGADETELDRLRGILRRGQGEPNLSSDNADATGSQGLRMPAVGSTPISDIGVKTKILSLAYPSLYLWGKGDFATSRQRTVDVKPFVQHMLRLS
ncbi:hypothetical protein E4U58_006590 [Claviceps cyperi]|nr:hypothetical protein E4U58_006590 [Claviceps cyperi]